MTADPTPERLSAEEREAEALADSIAGCFSNVSDLPEWMQVQALGRYMRPLALIAARAVLASDWYAAHLADVEARLATVEAEVTGAGCMCRGAHYVCVKHRVLSALHPGHGEPR